MLGQDLKMCLYCILDYLLRVTLKLPWETDVLS